mgnify:CR=1 FL=1
MDIATILGTSGAILSTISNIPQCYKVRNANTTNDIHSYSVVIHMLSAGIWSAYGFYLELYILGVESMFVAFLNLLILFAIFRDRCIYSNNVHKNEQIIKSTIDKNNVNKVTEIA